MTRRSLLQDGSLLGTLLPSAETPLKVPARFITPANTGKFRTALAAVRAGTADARVLCIGDSTTYGSGSQFGPPTSWPARLATLLDAGLFPSARGLFLPPSALVGGSGTDANWTAAAGWSLNAQGFAGQAAFYSSTVSPGVLKFQPGFRADTADVWYLQQNNSSFSGIFTISVDGVGTAATVDTLGATAKMVKVAVPLGSPAAGHYLNFVHTGGNGVWNFGVEFYDSTRKTVRWGNAGLPSTLTSHWAADGATYQSLPNIRAYAPDLALISLGINDAYGSISKASYKTNLTAIVQAAKASGDVVLVSVPPSTDASPMALEAQYRDAAREVAQLTGSVFVDIFGRWGSWAAANAKGYMYDGRHPSDTGYQDIAQAVFDTLAFV